jgi:DNA-binding MarR family transcriptional regulator
VSTTTTPTELRGAWRELMAAHARVSEALERVLQQRHDLSLTEFEVLQRLAETGEGYRRMQELAVDVHLSPSALSRLVGRLEKAGLAFRDICVDDRRGIYCNLTEAGRAAYAKAEPTHDEVLAATLGA